MVPYCIECTTGYTPILNVLESTVCIPAVYDSSMNSKALEHKELE